MATNNITVDVTGMGYASGSVLVTSAGSNGTWASGYTNTPWVTTTADTYTIAPNAGNPAVNISTKGITMPEGTDIKIGEKSIRESLDAIEKRLAILQINESLESEWEELKQLGNAYRALEKEIQEKMKTWEILKK